MPVTAKKTTWSPWRSLNLTLTPQVLALILDDGQAFRWHKQTDDTWLGFFDRHVVRLRLSAQQDVEYSLPQPIAPSAAEALRRYLDLDRDYAAVFDALPWRSDAHLNTCLTAFPGLRLLKQPFGETLLCFLCSSTKQIPQIKQMTEAMASSLGEPLTVPDLVTTPTLSFHSLPTWERLAQVAEAQLRQCGLGFRAAYVKGCAAFLTKNPGWLEETENTSYAEAHKRLMTLPGVGAKIADCCLLYGAGKFEAFPTDTWIIKTMAHRYGLDGWAPDHISHFGRTHFGHGAGLAQQYLFNYERKAEKSPKQQSPAKSRR